VNTEQETGLENGIEFDKVEKFKQLRDDAEN
jgi:hypothetical protein